MFKYVESELLSIETELPAVKTAGNYGRVNKFAAQALLARIYLNAQIYTGTAKNNEAVTYAKKVIDGGYTLLPNYRHLLLADNNINNTEAILTINYDGVKTQLFGGSTFITHAAIGGNMSAPVYGVKEGWAGLRTTKSLVNLFPNADGSTDTRAQFFTDGQALEINSLSTFKDGYAVTKYRNVTKAGASGSDATFTDIDVPLFRLAEMYLIYAEATLRGGSGDNTLALTYFNKLRERAYNGVTGNVASINLNLILDERSRELYWEGHRRTDLVRYAKFTTDTYLWPWKGGVKAGKSVEAFRNLFPLPSADVSANTNLTQNTGY